MPELPSSDADGGGRVQSVDRAFAVLRELTATPKGATALELSRRTGIERTTVHRLLKTLIHWGMVTAHEGTYALGPECLLFAAGHISRREIRRAVLPYAVELQEKVLQGRSALVSISIPARDRIVIVERIWTPLTPMNVIIEIGDQFLIDECASGKSVLSTYSEERCIATLGQARYDKIRPDLRKIRQAGGFCMTVGNYKRGLASIALPFRGQSTEALGAIVVSGLDLEDCLDAESPLAQHLHRACENVSAALRHG
ncbi:IclR family transcriptional regulator [Pigmentiphaga sp.]|uniref:IclR family transcriptional regulator n=1 Tax=Pigmentiphaga sp. TaxID=1977564 RepID=UPI0025D57E38|nr:IclR family transcriptional regulator [Pigmentiphaga sp.]MBX6318365.1 IclR family transcriptional regulator [Pigmentiphaga sp.]